MKELEAKLGIPSEASLSSSSEPEGATGEASTSLQVLEPHPTRPSVRASLPCCAEGLWRSRAQSPAAIASLERLDLASLARPSSPSSSSALSPRVNYSSPSIGSPSFGGVRRRRSKRQGRPTTDSPARNGVNGFTSDDDDDLVITLTSPATSACTSSTTVPAPSRLSLPPSVIGLGIGSSASSEAGEGDDEAETEPEEDDSETEEAFGGESAQLAPVPLGMDVRVQPATPDGTELAAVA